MTATAGRKSAIARALRPLPLEALGRRLERSRPRALIINLHSVPASRAGELEQLLQLLGERFSFGDPFALEAFAAEGVGEPTVVLSFDDGLANHTDVAAPLLAAHGARAVFAVPAAFHATPPSGQAAWFREHVYPAPTELHPEAELRAATWEQLADLARSGHRICSHGFHHRPLRGHEDEPLLRAEIVESRAELERRLPGIVVDGFCWPVRAAAPGSPADALVRSTYEYALGGGSRAVSPPSDRYRLPRLNLEVSWPRRVVDFQLLRAAIRA